MTNVANLFANIPAALKAEWLEPLLETRSLRLERIVSTGQATPAGEWCDQAEHEWVVLLRGRAGLLFAGEPEPVVLQPGDYVLIPAHRRHRVEWTDPTMPTVWLALYYRTD